MKLASKIFVVVVIGMLMSSFKLTNTKPNHSVQSEKPFIIVGQMPRFPGGKLAMNRYISENMSYPFEAMKHRIQGKVNVEFVVEKDGSLIQVRTVGKKLGYGLEEQAVKIFTSMPKWIPGKQDGKLVPVYMMIPIIYSL
jgi:protein TonB